METSELKYGSKIVASCWNDWLLFNIVYEKPITAIEIHEHDSDDCAVITNKFAFPRWLLYPHRDRREEMTVPILNKGTTRFSDCRAQKVDRNYFPQFSNLVDKSEFDPA